MQFIAEFRLTSVLRNLALVLTALSASLWAQSNAGQITGTVYDQTKAVVGGVAVSVASLATNVTQTTTTNKDGIYSVPELQPGTYRVTLEKAGFSKLIREPITMEGGRMVELDFNLSVGSTGTQVTINADVPIIQTATSTIQYGFDLKQIDELPVLNQSAIQILALLPGVQGDPGSEQAAVTTGYTIPGAGLSISGSAPGTGQFQVDGVSNTSLYFGRIALPLSTDAIGEMQVVQNSYSAEYRSGGGAVVSMTTKSGTNQLHGTVFSFSQNDALNAAPWLKYNKKGVLRYWRGGVDAGGPVEIPKLYNGRNRTFFFANYEPLRQYTQAQAFDRVATAAEREGDFSQSLYNTVTNQPVEIFQHFQPGSNKAVAQASTGYPQFPNNIIPPSLISPLGQKLLDLMPLPNMPLNGLGQNYSVFRYVKNSDDRYLFRIDHVISSNHHIAARFAEVPTQGQRFNLGGYIEWVPVDHNTGTNATFSDTYTWGSNKVNEFRYGYNRSNNSRTETEQQLSINGSQKFGLPSYLTSGMPIVSFADANVQSYGSDVGNYEIDNFSELSDTLSWMKGKHNLKIGADWQAPQQNLVDLGNKQGTWYFWSQETNIGSGNTGTVLGIPNATTGMGLASILLGYPYSISISPTVIPYQYRWKYVAGFVQDDWKATSRLTINVGLRYQVEVPRSEKHHWQGPFVDQPITLPGGSQQQGYVQLDGLGGAPNTLWPTRYNNIEPRFGFAYRVRSFLPGLQVIRGAYAINHVPTSGLFSSAIPNLSPQPASLATNGAANGGQVQIDFDPLVLPTGGVTAPANGQFTNLNTVASLYYLNPHVKIPYVQQWNFGLGFQFGSRMGLEVNYVGNKSTDMFGPSSIFNQVNLPEYIQEFESGLNMNQSIPNPQGILGANGQVINVTRTNSLRPLSTFGDIYDPLSQGYDARYNSLQINFTKRFSGGLQFNVNYVWMRAMDDVSCMGQFCGNAPQAWGFGGPQSPSDSHSLEKSISTYDVPNTFRMNFNWEVPVGRGKHFLNRVPYSLDQVIGSWKLSGNLEERTGFPVAVMAGTTAGLPDNPNSYAGDEFAQLRPNIVSGVNPILPNWKANCDNPVTGVCDYVNTAFFSPPGAFSLGNAPRVMDYLRSPHVQNFNMAILKEVPIHEKVKLVFRAELYGALNHAVFVSNINYSLYTGLNYSGLQPGAVPAVTPINITPQFSNMNISGQRKIQLGLKLYF